MVPRLLLLALVCASCLSCALAADVATVRYTKYTTTNCSDAGTVLQTVNTGVCSGSSQAFCSTDGNAYSFTYTDSSCTIASVLAITQITPTCGVAAPGYILECVNADLGPSPPLTFPPEGWATATTYKSQAGVTSTTCAVEDDTVTTAIAAKLGVCMPVTSSTTRAQYCSADGTQFGVATFSDTSCGAVERVNLTSTGCQAGQITVCPTSGGVFPLLPTTGYVQYNNSECTANSNTVENRYSANCLSSQEFTCSTDGTSATLQAYNATDSGQCLRATDGLTLPLSTCTSNLEFSCSLPQVGVSSGSVAQVITTQFINSDCSDVGVVTSSAPTGVCRQASGGISTASFCAADGSAYYLYQYTGSECTVDKLLNVQQFTPACGIRPLLQLSCVNASLGPAPPTVFPPPGWATATTYSNQATTALSTTCAAGPNVVQLKIAARLGVEACVIKTSTTSFTQFCTPAHDYYVEVSYSGTTCDPTQIQRAVLRSTGCQAGQITTCPSDGPTLPTLPTHGYTQYDNTACTLNTKATEHRYSTNCFSAQTFACNNNGTATLVAYQNVAAQGLCDAESAHLTLPLDTCTSSVKFECSLSQPQLAAANTNGASIVTMLIAAIVAWMAATI